ncbi:zinc finger BED domain-containing protein RICESLEEPER 2-like protein [Tanacetum coccineum]|uniref:Zinc finger BED domain-containing protein RICESLEEPER 2-like protein n=1 Tax=Tanacetum coccineum TaxID=301880 RepID=A0ABQ4YW56_9ASTR
MAFSALKCLSFMFIELFVYIRMIFSALKCLSFSALNDEECLDCEENQEYFNHENDEEFTFMYLDENNTPIPADKALKNKDIHPIFPLFDLNLLSHEERKQLPINPQVNKVSVESDQVALSSTSECDTIKSVAMGPYCTWKKQPPKLSKKSKSTCFPKLWRLKDKVGCSNSDGRDAFVFLKKPVRSAVEGSSLKGNGGKRKGLKAENGKFSGHEVCLRSMGPFCMWRKQPPKLSKKSNSTCFSKLWRLKDKVGCSNSDGPSRYQNACARVRHTPINEPVPSQAPLTGHCHQQMIEEPLPSKTIKRAMAKLPNRPQKIQALANRFINRKDRNEQIHVASPDGIGACLVHRNVIYYCKEGTVFAPALEGMKHDKSEQGEMLSKPFLDVCKQILPVIGKDRQGKQRPRTVLVEGELWPTIGITEAQYQHASFYKLFSMEIPFPVLSRMAQDILSIQAISVASDYAFSTSGRVLSIRRTRLTQASLEMKAILDEEVLVNETLPLSDEEIALDEAAFEARSKGSGNEIEITSD